MTEFEATVINAVTAHMNGDHPEDNLLIAQAFGRPGATASVMVGLDGTAGIWRVTDDDGETELSVEWPGGPITERPEIRREVVVLYTRACEKLGVPAREEHATAANAASGAPGDAAEGHGGHGSHEHGGAHGHGPGTEGHGGHGHGSAHAHGAADSADDGSFSRALREATWGDHSDSEGSSFMEEIMRAEATLDDYVSLVAQHYFMYEALETASEQLAADPEFSDLHPEALVRLPAIREDLEYFLGPDWRDKIEPLPATAAYAKRIDEIAEEHWLPGIVAHHYTRYLGDLSGGQMIAKRVAMQHGFDRQGVAFYDFSQLGSIPAFKAGYREALDRIGASLSEEERQRVVAEVRDAYRHNTATFIDMDRARAAAA